MRVQLTIIIACIAASSCKTATGGAAVKFIGGEEAEDGDFPATIRFKLFDSYGGSGTCGAGKIGPRRFLTAAHCMKGMNYGPGEPIVINFGVKASSSNALTAHVTKATVHDINQSGADSAEFGFDAAVFEIDKDTPAVQVAKISTTPLKVGNVVAVSGYGCEGDVVTPGLENAEGTLHFGLVPVKSVEARHNHFERSDAAGNEARACPGDSGTPAYSGNAPYKTIVGVNSYRRIKAGKEIWLAAVRFDSEIAAADQKWLKDNAVPMVDTPIAQPAQPSAPAAGKKLTMICLEASNDGIAFEFDESAAAGSGTLYVGKWFADQNQFVAALELPGSEYKAATLAGKRKLTLKSSEGDAAEITYDAASKVGSGKFSFKSGGGYSGMKCRRD